LAESTKLVRLQWAVIVVLLIGGTAGIWLIMHKADQYKAQRDANNGNVASLREQVRQAKLTPKPSSAALPEAVANGPATPRPTATPKAKR